MPQLAFIYRVLIASPSDCIQERKAIPEVIYSWNAANALNSGAIIEPVLWETHSTPELGDRPQAIINKQLIRNCDLLIGVFWTRLGTHTGKAKSGTVEEINEFHKANKPVLLYFSSAPVHPDSIDTEQYKALLEYRKILQSEGLVSFYDSIGDLREKLQRHISSTMISLHAQIKTDHVEMITNPSVQVQMFKSQFESFLRRLEAEWATEKESEPVSIEEGKYIIERALADILDFLSMIVKDDETNLSSLLKESSRRLKQLCHHELLADGNQSYNAFWKEGDSLIDHLKRIPTELDSVIRKLK